MLMTTKAKEERNVALDILRVLAMFGIVVLHVLGHGGLLDESAGTLRGNLLWLVESICYFSVNIFVLISGYFMCDGIFKLSKVTRLIVDITFWSLICFGVLTVGKLMK